MTTTTITNQRTALLVGASGLVGGHLLTTLLADDEYSSVTALVRKPIEISHTKLTQETVDFTRLSDYVSHIQAQDVFCALGTTIRVAGSQEAFRKVDFEYPLRTAEVALLRGAEQFLLVSSLGADATSSVFYSRTKGEVEQAIETLGYRSFVAFRPSLLLGERSESRFGESIGAVLANVIGFAMIGPLAKYKAIEASTVAWTMVNEAKKRTVGRRVVESDAIQVAFDGQ
jgi:uncharacterized protein YbjT (DUF2867 family)